ncbi:MAG: hypothetical protein FWD69_07770 [Polyangiaceae bacterium]|nr:hypothetical protein [Polyangiaceae bacterium]
MYQIIVERLRYSDNDYGAIIVLLSRLGLLLNIDNRLRFNKDIYVFFYVIQLISLKKNCTENESDINYFFRSLCFELMMDYEVYTRFFVKENKLFLKSDTLGSVEFKDVLRSLYAAIEQGEKRLLLSRRLADFQVSIIELLFSSDRHEYALNFNDRNEYLVYPQRFLDTYEKNKEEVFSALADCFNEAQSGHNLLVSNFIIMNYSYYVLKDNPRAALQLKEYVGSGDVFSRLISTVVYRAVAVNRKMFSGLGIDEDFLPHPLRGDESIRLFNLIYTARRR